MWDDDVFYLFSLSPDRLLCDTKSGLSKMNVRAIANSVQYYLRHPVGGTRWGITRALNKELSQKGNIQHIVVSEKNSSQFNSGIVSVILIHS